MSAASDKIQEKIHEMNNTVHPTPYTVLNTLLIRLRAEIQVVLGDLFTGLYLHGSLAGGDFDPLRSDIDFLVAVRENIFGSQVGELGNMHASLIASRLHWVERLEGSYIPLDALRRYEPANSHHPALRVDGSFGIDGHGPDWIIQRHVLREKGIQLYGPDLKSLIDPVPPDAVRRAARETLFDWWVPQLDEPSRLLKRDYQAYAVLTMCRALYTLEHGEVVSKPAAAKWAVNIFGEHWKGLIERALAWQTDEPLEEIEEVLAFIRWVIERA
jgi:predicted nucleotidyltransferase